MRHDHLSCQSTLIESEGVDPSRLQMWKRLEQEGRWAHQISVVHVLKFLSFVIAFVTFQMWRGPITSEHAYHNPYLGAMAVHNKHVREHGQTCAR